MFDIKLLKNIDWLTIIIVFVLVAFGLLSIASIMSDPLDGSESGISDYLEKLNLQYVQKQSANFLFGITAFLVVLVLDYEIFKKVIFYLFVANIFLLVMLFLTEKARGIFGWFKIAIGTFERAIQPGELCKISIILMLARFVSQTMDKEGRLRGFIPVLKCVMICAVPTVLVMLQPDFGTAFVYICIMIFVFFVAKIGWGYILAAAGLVAAGLPLSYFFVMSDSQRQRIDVFLDPELDPLNKGYNVAQSKIAIGSGQLYGKGFFSSGTLAQLRFVPERHTDFIFAGIVEGVGFIGGAALILIYFVLIFRWLYIAAKSRDNYGACIVVGVVGMLTAHVFENIGMTIGLMPVTGIPLPFISYGGSNLLTNMLGVGLVESVWIRRQTSKHG